MTARFVDPQHIEVIIAAAKERVQFGCGCGWTSMTVDPQTLHPTPLFDQCFPHLVLGLLRPTVEAAEVPF